MNIKNEIELLLKKALEKMEIYFEEDLNLEHPQDLKNGDFTTNIAMMLAGRAGKNPREFAKQIHSILEESKNIEKVEIAGPGYLNFFLSKEFFKNSLEENFALQNSSEKKEKILFEHTSPNLFKPFHIGHMVNNSISESLSRVLRYVGNEVINITFPSDVSPGIAKTIWALKEKNKKIETLTLKEISEAYVFGSEEYKKDNYTKNEVDKINFELYKKIESENLDFYKKGKELSLKHFEEMTSKLGSNFLEMIFESQAEEIGKNIVKENIDKVFKKSNGAVIFEGENYTNVFINSQDFGTYLAKDIGLLKIKSEKYYDFQKSLVMTDVEQKQHFEMVKEAGKKIPEIKDFVEKSIYLQHGRMNFTGNIKISSRYGNVPLVTEVIDKVKENILEKMKDRDFSEKESDEISEKLAIATLKYSTLKVTSGKNISFDIEKDTNPQGNSAPYILYSLVRAKSILRNINDIDNLDLDNKKGNLSNLERKFYLFNEFIEKIIQDYSPHNLANYLYDLAQEFNSFYTDNKILDDKNLNYKYNLYIVKKYNNIMEKGLELLGIETVEKM